MINVVMKNLLTLIIGRSGPFMQFEIRVNILMVLVIIIAYNLTGRVRVVTIVLRQLV